MLHNFGSGIGKMSKDFCKNKMYEVLLYSFAKILAILRIDLTLSFSLYILSFNYCFFTNLFRLCQDTFISF